MKWNALGVDEYDLWLDGAAGLGPRSKLALACGLGGAAQVYDADWDTVSGLLSAFQREEGSGAELTRAREGGNRYCWCRERWETREAELTQAGIMLRQMKKGGIRGMTALSGDYPQALLGIYDPPWILYYRGESSVCRERCTAVVGARKASVYGKWAGRRMGETLASMGITVVSGMASGVDACAHQGALSAGGTTVAVLGCGVDVCYPKSSEALMREIPSHGVIFSEYPPGTEPAPYRFPRRNRIISGLSSAVIVAEAGVHSGSLITAGLAADQGREVYAVPANINSGAGLGANLLIRDGAVPICSMEDLKELFGGPFGQDRGQEDPIRNGLGGDEALLYDVLRRTGTGSVDELCAETGKTASEINGILTVLEIKGIICGEQGKIFIAK